MSVPADIGIHVAASAGDPFCPGWLHQGALMTGHVLMMLLLGCTGWC